MKKYTLTYTYKARNRAAVGFAVGNTWSCWADNEQVGDAMIEEITSGDIWETIELPVGWKLVSNPKQADGCAYITAYNSGGEEVSSTGHLVKIEVPA